MQKPFKNTLKILLFSFCLLAGLPSLAGPAWVQSTGSNDNATIVFIYHRFGDDRYPSTNIRLDQFQAQIEYLKNRNFNFPTLEEVIVAQKTGVPLSGQNVLITVDDGYASIRDKGWPLLKAAGIPMVLFISTGPIDEGNRDYMSWDDLRQLKAEGVTIAHHGTGHLHSIHAGVSATIRDYLKASVRFQEELGEAPTVFAWPYGEFSPELITAFKAGGVAAAFGQFSGPLATTSNLYALPRFPINEAFGDLDRFKLVANSYPLNLTITEPVTPLVSANNNPPLFKFYDDQTEPRVPNMTCYPSHSGTPIKPIEYDDGTFEIVIDAPFPKGRHKVSCTLMRKSGTATSDPKWYWVSQPFFNFPELNR